MHGTPLCNAASPSPCTRTLLQCRRLKKSPETPYSPGRQLWMYKHGRLIRAC